MRRTQTATLQRKSGRILVLWGETDKEIPAPPDEKIRYGKTDSSYWYGREYAGWNAEKANIPVPPVTGAAGKKVIYIQPGVHPYMDEYRDNLQIKARSAGIELQVMESGWDDDRFDACVDEAVSLKPDLILLNPENQKRSTEWYCRINQAGIPVLGGNFMPAKEGFAYIVAWTGPDDWGQSRLLARSLADSLKKRGNYAILQHYEETSSYYARTYGVITELKKRAPLMKCLDCQSTGLDREKSREAVKTWLDRFGADLQGIFCADDSEMLLGALDAMEEAGRDDVVLVATGSSRTGLELLRDGKLSALSYQSAAVDGSIAMETIIDWFQGVPVEPIRYLPKYIVSPEEAEEFLKSAKTVESVNLGVLYKGIEDLDWQKVYDFFGDVYEVFLSSIIVPLDVFQGFLLELITGLVLIVRRNSMDVTETLGAYDSLMKHMVREDDIARMLEWVSDLCQNVIFQISLERNRKTPIQLIVEFLENHYHEPLSLKTLAHKFSFSQAYLGQLFRQETGEKFNDYLNRKRIEKACELLRGDNVVASQIAREVGYSDSDYFYKIFKKSTGITVSAFIKGQNPNNFQ